MRRRTGYELSYSSARCGEIRQTQFKKLRKRGAFLLLENAAGARQESRHSQSCRACLARVAPFAVMPSMHGKSRAIRSHAEFEERGIQLFLVTQSDEFVESAESRKFARFVRGSVARREATHKAGAATEFFDFFRDELFVMEACFENAMMEHRIDVQRDGREDRGHSHGAKHFQESKAVTRSFRLS